MDNNIKTSIYKSQDIRALDGKYVITAMADLDGDWEHCILTLNEYKDEEEIWDNTEWLVTHLYPFLLGVLQESVEYYTCTRKIPVKDRPILLAMFEEAISLGLFNEYIDIINNVKNKLNNKIMTKQFQFSNGDRVKEKVTGFSGIITGICFYLTGCTQYLVTPPSKDGMTKSDAQWYDEGRLELMEAAVVDVSNVSADIPAPIR
jgi:hypothetical protein